GREPFHTVYLHGTVRDMQHVKMSKSLGNGIDPLDVVQLYGADALRYTVIAGLGLGTDLMLDPGNLEQSFAPGRNFVTKLWNIGRFILQNLGDAPAPALADIDPARLSRADAWILGRLDAAIAECDAALGPTRPARDGRWTSGELYAGLRLSELVEAARRFAWNELADWYVETTKPRLGGPDADVARAVLVHAFDAALRLLHPVVPFITETLWQAIAPHAADEFIARAAWPVRRTLDDAAAREFELVREAVGAIRQIRAEYNIAPGARVAALVGGAQERAGRVLAEEASLIGHLTRADVSAGNGAGDGGAAANAVLSDGSHVRVPLAGAIDLGKECGRLRGELEQLATLRAGIEQRLGNERFVTRAKPEVVAGERRRLEELTMRAAQLTAKVETLCGG
ncbi:MAG TPA: class I tRNA ligase family protein, partial [Gemmatimonadaceae bacterium]